MYRQLYAYLRDEIRAGRLADGARIPPTRELAGQLGLNRTTVSAAYELLEQDGLIRGHVGRGSFVQAPTAGEVAWDEVLPPRPAAENPAAGAPDSADVIGFDTARPSAGLFPLEEFRDTVAEALAGGDAARILQLGSPFGYGPLREFLMARAGARPTDDLLITNGCQQALDLIQRSLTAAGDTVLVEDPVYPGLKNVFLRAGIRLVGVPMQQTGLDMDALERLLQRERPRLLVLTPNFQNPTGLTLTRAAREAVLKLARAARAIVVENDIYGELRYTGAPVPTLRDLDAAGDVIQLKSFSKIAFPGLRVGWVTGPRAVLSRLAETKQWTDLHSDHLAQAVLLRFAESGRLERHLERVREAGGERLRATLGALDGARVEGLRFTRPEGGMNLWVRLPEPLDADDLLTRAQRENVTFLPGRWFGVSRAETGALRLSFAGLEPERIRAGIGTLAHLMAETRRRAPVAAIV